MSDAWEKRWRIVAWATTLIAAASLVEAIIVATHHLASPGWPAHARFHATIGGLYAAVLSVLAVLLAWGPLRRGERMARLALIVVLVAIPSMPLAGILLVPDGGPPAFDRALAIAGVLAALAIAFACRRGSRM